MIDFRKKLGKTESKLKTNPIDIYDSLDRTSETGPLRPVQEFILNEWFSKRIHEKDIIIKLHTGQGKTLIGLLILLSKLNSNNGPCLYLCPNNYLVTQTCYEANKFGIPYSVIESDGSIPSEFLNAEKILITTIQKLFNGKTVFGIGSKSIHLGTIVLDDSHACIDSIRNALSIKVNCEHKLYKTLFRLFESDIQEQGEGSFLEIKAGKYDALLPVPYWSWFEKKQEVLCKIR